jgi:hypothetical protein
MGDDNDGSVFLGKQPIDSLLDVELTLSASSAEVASSNIRILGFFMTQRALLIYVFTNCNSLLLASR